ncbi:MAG TPA: TetR/AcrR family transcriptional regulator [Candidatus Binataceae bacterium]|nr:TetR/AcrR family transcriptional regulator [Candidatus Binataceae bacterium]
MEIVESQSGQPQPRRMSAERRREHLLDMAASIILNEGFEALTMEGVSERAGVSKGLGYAYFENADDLALALYDREVSEVYERIERESMRHDSYEQRVRQAVRTYFDLVATRGVLLAVLQTRLSGRKGRRTRRERLHRFIGFWADQIQQEFGAPRPVAESIAAATLSASDTFARGWAAHRLKRREIERVCSDFLLGAARGSLGTPAAQSNHARKK